MSVITRALWGSLCRIHGKPEWTGQAAALNNHWGDSLFRNWYKNACGHYTASAETYARIIFRYAQAIRTGKMFPDLPVDLIECAAGVIEENFLMLVDGDYGIVTTA